MTISRLFQVSDIMPFIVLVFGNYLSLTIYVAANDVNTVFGRWCCIVRNPSKWSKNDLKLHLILYLHRSRTKWIICNKIPLLWRIIKYFGFLVVRTIRASDKWRPIIHTQRMDISMWIIWRRLHLDTISIEPWKIVNSWFIEEQLTNGMPVLKNTKNKKEFQMRMFYIPRDNNQSLIHQFCSICNFQFC